MIPDASDANDGRWKATKLVPAPSERAIWIRANVALKDGCLTSVEAYEGFARWDEQSKDWLDARGLSIRGDFDAEIIVLDWMELIERAGDCPDCETAIDANVYHWDSEHRREDGTAGFFALCGVRHTPTNVALSDRRAGPFPTRGAAIAALTGLILEATQNTTRTAA